MADKGRIYVYFAYSFTSRRKSKGRPPKEKQQNCYTLNPSPIWNASRVCLNLNVNIESLNINILKRLNVENI